MRLREYTFLGTTQSLCPECLALVPAKIVERGGRVYFRKRCPAHGVRRHPTQVYESLFHLGMALLLGILIARDGLRYQRLKLYLIAYGVYRFATEFIRPEPAWWLGLTFYQWAALALVVGLVIHWQFDRRLRLAELPPAAGQGGSPEEPGRERAAYETA